jgi:hypothetical protein
MNYVSLFVGWLLGILNTLLIDRITKHCKKQEVKTALLTELDDVRVRLAGTIYKISSRLGTLNKDLMSWTFKIFAERGSMEVTTEDMEAMAKIEKMSAAEIQVLVDTIVSKQGQVALSLKKFFLPFLDSNISHLPLFDVKFQSLVLEIRTKLTLLNEEIELGRFFYEKTFDSSLSVENHRIVTDNLNELYRKVGEMAQLTADKITELIEKYA